MSAGLLGSVASERRGLARFGATIPALIHVADNLPLSPCMLLDVSDNGGRIRLEARLMLPNHFTLLLTSNGRVRRECRVIWRQDVYLGVAFVGRFDPVGA